jgi:uncharacterized pyridoxal phosphate-containing UPF0001 family protein
VLVSKLKPASDVAALHQHAEDPSIPAHLRPSHFGENYVQELTSKAAVLPRSIRWHFIGGLQSNKCKGLAEIPNLWCVSSVDTAKKADLLDKGRQALLLRSRGEGGGGGGGNSSSSSSFSSADGLEHDGKLRVKVQVNTSGEESKAGVEPGDDALELCRHVVEKCPHLTLAGLMTIGAIARSHATTPDTENDDFTCLVRLRDRVADSLGIPKDLLELSMGMSADYEGAIAHGSNEVRIGSTIFGERPLKQS